jgi:Protein of unknown function (DUF3383)
MVVQNTANINTVPFIRGLTSSLFEDNAILKQIAPTSGKLVTGNTTANLAALQAVGNGEFSITIDGVVRDITGLVLTGLTLGQMASVIQTKIQLLVPGFLVTQNAGIFEFLSPTTGPTSAVGYMTAVSGGSGTDISGAGMLKGKLVDGALSTAGTLRVTPLPRGTVMAKDPVSSLWIPYVNPNASDGTEFPRGILLTDVDASSITNDDVTDIPLLIKGDFDVEQLIFENGVTLTDVISTKKVQVGDFLREIDLYYVGTVNTEEFQPLN